MHQKTNILLVYEAFIASVRLCAYEQLKYMQKEGKINFAYGCSQEITSMQCEWADIVIFVRSSTWLEYKIAKKCKRADKFMIYILDDDLLEIAQDSTSAEYYRQEAVKKRIKWFIKNSNVFMSPSIYILEKYKKDAKKTIQLEEPCLKKETLLKKNRKLKIGFAGSVDRAGDVQRILQEAIEIFYEKHKEEVEIEFMGVKTSFIDKLGLTYYPYEENYEQYQKRFFSLNWDIGLAPMPNTEFHRGKHYNKYIEYGSIGCVGIFSNVIPYTYAIKNKENGILCENRTEDWIEALEWCLSHPAELEIMKKNVEIDMNDKFLIEKIANHFIQTLPEITCYKSKKQKKFYNWFYIQESRFMRYVEFVMRNGKNVPKKIFHKIRECKSIS